MPQPVESLELTAADAPVWKGIMILYCILIAILYRHLLLFSLNLKYFCYYHFFLILYLQGLSNLRTLSPAAGLIQIFFYQSFSYFLFVFTFSYLYFSYFLLVFIFCNCNASPTCARFVAYWGGEKATLSASNCFVASTLECDYILPWRVGDSNYILDNLIIILD